MNSIDKNLSVRKTIRINTDPSKVWDALTNPKMIKKYLFDTNVKSEWKIGSKISFEGNYQGKKFKDKGIIQKLDKEKLFQYTYLSEFSGLEDKDENYSIITFELITENEKTKLMVTQNGFVDKKAQEHSDKGWSMVFRTIKNILEQN